MFPSNCTSHHNPFSYFDQPFDFQINPPSNQESDDEFPNLSFFHFPSSPFEDYQFFLNQQQTLDFPEADQLANKQPEEPQEVVDMNMGAANNKTIITRKRPGKRDRHSKIKTARGLRDRRMRLSLQVAKRFFHLQDMLGFDKASKTVEWLLKEAKEGIKQVAGKNASEFELGLSSSPEDAVINENQEEKKPKGVKKRNRKISAFHHPLAKVSREKARERARERTKEKIRSKKNIIDSPNWVLGVSKHQFELEKNYNNDIEC